MVFKSITKVMTKSINVAVDDSPSEKRTDVEEDVGTSHQQIDAPEIEADIQQNDEAASIEPYNPQTNKEPSTTIQKNHPKELIIGNLDQGITTRSREVISNSCFVSKFEPKIVKEALTDEF